MKLLKLSTYLVVVTLAPVWFGCGKKEAAAKASEPNVTNQASGLAAAREGGNAAADQASGLAAAREGGNAAADLAMLDKNLHDYVALKKIIPRDLNALVTDRFLSSLPKPPPGRRFAIQLNPLGYHVVLVDE